MRQNYVSFVKVNNPPVFTSRLFEYTIWRLTIENLTRGLRTLGKELWEKNFGKRTLGKECCEYVGGLKRQTKDENGEK
jgi:hypothetical protein